MFLALWSLAPTLARCVTDEAQVAEHFHAGKEALEKGELARAVEEFKKVLSLDPALVEAEIDLGLAYHSLCEYDLAASCLTKALRQRPNLVGPNVIAGIDYLKLDLPEKAIPLLQRGLKLDPSSLEARRALASCYLIQKNFRNAAEEYHQMADLDPDKAEAWFKLGHDYLGLSAHLAYQGAESYRTSAWGHRFLADLWFQRSRWDDAAREYRQGLVLEPQQPGLHTSLGQAYLHGGQLEKAEAQFRLELQRDSQDEPAWLGLAETELARGRATAALDDVGRVWKISPEFLALQRGFPTIDLSRNVGPNGVQPGAAGPNALIVQLQADPQGGAKDFMLAGLYAAAGETTQAADRWKAFQTDFQTWQNTGGGAAPGQGQSSCYAHRYASCARWLESRKSMSYSERLLLGRTQFTLQQYDRAADTFAQVPAAAKENVEAIYWLARSYQALGAKCYDRLETSFPDSWRAHQLRGEGYALRQDFDDALKEFQLAIQLQPNSAELHEALGELYLTKDSSEEARSELEKALALDSSRTHALCLLGRLYVRKRETEKAVPYLQRALRLQPDLADASGLLGTAYVRLGQFSSAIPELQKAAPFDFYGNVHYQLYLAYRNLGRSELATKALARSEELRKSSAESQQALVMGAASVGPDPQ